MCVQASGIGPIVVFSTTILLKLKEETNGEFPIQPRDGTILINLVTPIVAVLSFLVYKSLNRRTLLLLSHTFLVAAHGAIGLSMITEQYVILFVCMLLFLAWFQFFEGAMCFIYPAEVCVDTGMGVVLGGIFLSMILMSFTVQYMMASPLNIHGTFWVYSGLNLLCILFIYFFVKETKGKSAQELRELYRPVNRRVQSESNK